MGSRWIDLETLRQQSVELCERAATVQEISRSLRKETAELRRKVQANQKPALYSPTDWPFARKPSSLQDQL
jgi:hypothetical protein